jgi:hypothetical protein
VPRPKASSDQKANRDFFGALSKLFCRARAGDRFPTAIEDNVAAKLQLLSPITFPRISLFYRCDLNTEDCSLSVPAGKVRSMASRHHASADLVV